MLMSRKRKLPVGTYVNEEYPPDMKKGVGQTKADT